MVITQLDKINVYVYATCYCVAGLSPILFALTVDSEELNMVRQVSI